jgi:hypothetical protein
MCKMSNSDILDKLEGGYIEFWEHKLSHVSCYLDNMGSCNCVCV